MKKRENNPEDPSLKQLAILRYCACLVLHSSILTSVKEAGDKTVQSQQVIQLIPDVLRAYLHSSRTRFTVSMLLGSVSGERRRMSIQPIRSSYSASLYV